MVEEIDAIIKSFQIGKSPRLDDIIVGVLRGSLEWVKQDFVEVVCVFWIDGILTSRMLRGVIKLIPKLGDLEFLTNWRPITMLTLIYKVISKLLVAS